MPTALEALDETLNTSTYALLGDTITYTPAGGSALPIAALVEYDDQEKALAGSRVVGGDCAVEVAVADVPVWSATDEIVLPRRPGQVFLPKKAMLDETGMNWLMGLKTKPA
ncbi:MAG: hypothetical protein QOH47_2411 [Sphingomonadales bacterium]|jgi:hypothetical protein|nr:hypothetical protein [Sphingomonadales bacterium]